LIAAHRTLLAFALTVAPLAGFSAAASQIASDGDEGLDRILLADPSSDLRAYVLGSGFALESAERLDALNLSLMVVSTPDRMRSSAALADLQVKFPHAIMALDDPIGLARDARSHRAVIAGPLQVLTAIAWPAGGDPAGSGIRIGAIDGSLDASHPALRGAAIVQRTFTSGREAATDTAHGTAIAAMLVGDASDESVSGLLRGATLFYAAIFQNGKHGPVASSADFLRGIDWLVKSGVTVINASVTSTSRNAVVVYAMSLLPRGRLVLVAAAGNRGPSAPPVYPAAIPSAFAVTAVSIRGEPYRYANTGDYIDISAPGINLPTTSRKITSGTSLAVPFVTAAVALMIHSCGVSPAEAQSRLQADARDLGPAGWDSHFGWGMLQALPRCGEVGSAAARRPALPFPLRRDAVRRAWPARSAD
jgi:subtilisin family serine protease